MVTGVALATLFWLFLFGLKLFNFWWGMMLASGILAAWSLLHARGERKKLFAFRKRYILWGLISALILYAAFWAGHYVTLQIFPFAGEQVSAVYESKTQLQAWIIGLALFFWIAPAEEIFWRGMVQRTMAEKFGSNIGWVGGGVIYAAVHLWAANLMLFTAAFIGGLFWGWIYRKHGSLWPGMISHAVWDVLIFLIVPLTA